MYAFCVWLCAWICYNLKMLEKIDNKFREMVINWLKTIKNACIICNRSQAMRTYLHIFHSALQPKWIVWTGIIWYINYKAYKNSYFMFFYGFFYQYVFLRMTWSDCIISIIWKISNFGKNDKIFDPIKLFVSVR